jgi:outer membrane protein
MRRIALIVAAVLVIVVGATSGQTPAQPTQPAPSGQAPPQQPAPKPATPPATQPPTPAAPPKPFPEGAKIAYVIMQRIFFESTDGKAAAAKIQALEQKKTTEINEKNKALQGLTQKLEKEASVMSPSAQADLQKQAERTRLEIERSTQDAQQELQELQGQIEQDFNRKVQPLLGQVAQEKGLHFIFNGQGSGIAWADSGLDVTADVIKKLDAATKTPAPPPATKPPGQ